MSVTATVTVFDAIHANIGHLPPGPAAGYSTGSGPVPWTAADWKNHPGAVRICQDPGATDTTADILDVEQGAATLADCARWAEAAAANVAAGKRPGQRHPAIYMSLSQVTPVVNALIAGGIHEGPGLWIANWNLSAAEAAALIHASGGPFPVIAVQHRNAGLYDISAFSVPWLTAVSGDPPPPPPARFHGEYVTAGQLPLDAIAVKLGWPVNTLIRMTAVRYGTLGDDLGAWLAKVLTGGRHDVPVPAGVKLWAD